MSQVVTVSDTLYTRLENVIKQRGLTGIEQLLEVWLTLEETRRRRANAVQQIDALRDKLFARYGQMADSVNLLREDRGR